MRGKKAKALRRLTKALTPAGIPDEAYGRLHSGAIKLKPSAKDLNRKIKDCAVKGTPAQDIPLSSLAKKGLVIKPRENP